jgi:tRNA(adenine34) deaminase
MKSNFPSTAGLVPPSPTGSRLRLAMRLPCLLWALTFGVGLSNAAIQAVDPLPDDPACTAEDRKFMARAYELAAAASAKGNGAFGALVVKDGKILMEFSNNAKTSGDVSHHAETGLVSLTSIRLGVNSMKGCTFYTSTEPCIMCCGAINSSGITRLVYGTTATQVGLLRGRKAPFKPLQVREVFARAGRPEVVVVGPLMEKDGLAVHAAAFAKLDAKS